MAEAEGGASAQAERIAGLDTSVAHPARVYDYWLGGKDNFAADREAAERVLAVAPSAKTFRRRAVRQRRAGRARVWRPGTPDVYLISACAARSMIAFRSSRLPAR